MRHRKLYKTCIKTLQNLYRQNLIANQKSPRSIFRNDRGDTAMQLVHYEFRKTIRTGKNKFDHTAFVELFMLHLLKKNSRFYHLPKLRYMRNKKRYNIMDTCNMQK